MIADKRERQAAAEATLLYVGSMLTHLGAHFLDAYSDETAALFHEAVRTIHKLEKAIKKER